MIQVAGFRALLLRSELRQSTQQCLRLRGTQRPKANFNPRRYIAAWQARSRLPLVPANGATNVVFRLERERAKAPTPRSITRGTHTSTGSAWMFMIPTAPAFKFDLLRLLYHAVEVQKADHDLRDGHPAIRRKPSFFSGRRRDTPITLPDGRWRTCTMMRSARPSIGG